MTWNIKFIPFPNQNQFGLNLVKSEPSISRCPVHLAIFPSLLRHSESFSGDGLAKMSQHLLFVYMVITFSLEKKALVYRCNGHFKLKSIDKKFLLFKRHHQVYTVSENPPFKIFLRSMTLYRMLDEARIAFY